MTTTTLGCPEQQTRKGGGRVGHACPTLSFFQMHPLPILSSSMFLFFAESICIGQLGPPNHHACCCCAASIHAAHRYVVSPPPSCAFCVCAQGEICMHETSWWKLARKSPGGFAGNLSTPFRCFLGPVDTKARSCLASTSSPLFVLRQ